MLEVLLISADTTVNGVHFVASDPLTETEFESGSLIAEGREQENR